MEYASQRENQRIRSLIQSKTILRKKLNLVPSLFLSLFNKYVLSININQMIDESMFVSVLFHSHHTNSKFSLSERDNHKFYFERRSVTQTLPELLMSSIGLIKHIHFGMALVCKKDMHLHL